MQTAAADEISALIRSCYKAMIGNDDEEAVFRAEPAARTH